MIKCIHTGDLHLGSQFRNASFDGVYAKQRRLEIWETFERIVDRAIENNTDFLFITGDLYEEKYFTIGDIKRVRDKLEEAKNTNIIITTGNHDPLGENSLYRKVDWPKNVHIFGSKAVDFIEFKELDTVIWGYSWDKKEEKKDILSEIAIEKEEKINILLIHGDLLNKDSVYLPMDKEVLESKGFDYVALGHIHKPQFITDKICYCGSPEPLDFGEIGIHGIIEGTIEKENVTMSLFPLSKRSFIIKEINISETMTYNEILDKIRKCDNFPMRNKNLYRIVLKGIRDRDIDFDLEDLVEVLSSEFYYLELVDNTTPDYDLERLEIENKNNIIGLFIEEMRKKDLNDEINKEALYIGLETLLKEKVMK
ncbi:DNA repair exonuclease [Anaerosalibacter bizertensis]|uniref:DNA repair exonuclease n=1 Tax=Anaerosalibacter bizertensis TaxID=932217 RepID=A0A844FGA4_9FIRM|nr:DNA repair exonuclease [Anaerosalibacter bizertensis]MBU5292657.1 DNA repair exonuclease [Anaerosalibacter bizertensis]MSS43009.1 DNA repair exonuclease [Anaerosalibacter bizertensis]